jgi:hypothetical protein
LAVSQGCLEIDRANVILLITYYLLVLLASFVASALAEAKVLLT